MLYGKVSEIDMCPFSKIVYIYKGVEYPCLSIGSGLRGKMTCAFQRLDFHIKIRVMNEKRHS